MAVAKDAGDLANLLEQNGYSLQENPAQPYLAKLPLKIKSRVCALKKLQMDSLMIESKFYLRVHELEKEFEKEFNEVYEKRRKIVAGEYEPTKEESDFPILHGVEEKDLEELNSQSEADTEEKGIPDFWLNALKMAEVVQDMIQEHDEPILKYLKDITTTIEVSPPGFTLYFHFAENPHFSNTVLKKKYELQMTPDEEDPFEFDGPSVVKAIGDEIKWLDGKNVTKKIIKKKQKKGANAGKFLTKTIKADSFFNYFETPRHVGEDEKNEDDDEETADLERADFEIGQIIRDHVVTRAVLFFTGEAADPDPYDDYEDEGDDDEESDDE